MKRFCLILAVLVCLVAGIAGGLNGQMAVPPQLPPRARVVAGASVGPPRIPAYNQIYCSGFIAEHEVQELFVVAGQEGGMRNEFIPGDILYLNKGTNWIVNPGGEYIMLRKMADVDEQGIFPGQRKLLKELGTFYSEIGRIRVNIINDTTATAEVLQACESIAVGDFAVPFDVKPAPALKASATFDQFAPPTGKTGGMIVAAKDFAILLHKGAIGYIDVGAKQGIEVGQYVRVYRPFRGSRRLDLYDRYRNEYPEAIYGMRLNVHLTHDEVKTMPREVLGEAVVLHVEGSAATILVTFSLRDIVVGDYVEVE